MEGYDENYMKVNSVYLFKKIFNLQCDDLGNSNLKIEELNSHFQINEEFNFFYLFSNYYNKYNN